MKAIFKSLLMFSIFIASTASLDAQTYHTQEKPLPCLDKTFTVVAHIVRDSFGDLNITQQDIESNFEAMNRYFEPICAEFKVCEFNIIDNFQYDSLLNNQALTELQTKYHRPNRINVFFVMEINIDQDLNEAGLSFGSIGNLTSGGIALEKTRAGAVTYAHEIGHYFGLPHTFVRTGTTELVNGSNCDSSGDNICDTPADPFTLPGDANDLLDPNEPCRFIGEQADANGEYYRPDVGNIMSYYTACACGFTHQQYVRMANAYLNSNPKMW